MAYNLTGTLANDTLNQSGGIGPGTIAGLAGDDSLLTGRGIVTVFAVAGAATVVLPRAAIGNTGMIDGGSGNDSIFADRAFATTIADMMTLFAGDGSDTINMSDGTGRQTIVGGNDTSDGGDSIVASRGDDLVYGNGGNDTLYGGDGNHTLIGGFGNDYLFELDIRSDDLVFGNEGNDIIEVDMGNDTVFGGLGDDFLRGSYYGGDVQYFGNEGADTLFLP